MPDDRVIRGREDKTTGAFGLHHESMPQQQRRHHMMMGLTAATAGGVPTRTACQTLNAVKCLDGLDLGGSAWRLRPEDPA
jgi:hypothetical protein